MGTVFGQQQRTFRPKDDTSQLRFPSFVDGTNMDRTPLPKFTKEWIKKRLGEIGRFSKGRGIRRNDVSDDGVPCIRYGEIYTQYQDYVISPVSRIPLAAANAALPINTGDILFACSGETAEDIGRCVAYLGEGEAFAGSDIIVLRPLEHNSMYLCYLLNHSVVATQKSRLAQGDAVVHINARNLAWVEIGLPPRHEQQAIANVLMDVDGLLGALEMLIAKKRSIHQAAMQQLLTGRTRLPGFRGAWETKRLGDIADVDLENLTSSTDPEYGFNYISLEQVEAGRLLDYTEETFQTAPSRARRILRRYDILMSTVRPNLMAHLFFRGQISNAICSTGFAVLRCKRHLSTPGFLFAHLFGHVVNRQIDKALAGSNYPAINSRDVQLIEIPCPPEVREQHAIAAVLSDMDDEIAALERRRDKTRAIKQGMMEQLLTGRVRLA